MLFFIATLNQFAPHFQSSNNGGAIAIPISFVIAGLALLFKIGQNTENKEQNNNKTEYIPPRRETNEQIKARKEYRKKFGLK